jgi:hypothetical protein
MLVKMQEIGSVKSPEIAKKRLKAPPGQYLTENKQLVPCQAIMLLKRWGIAQVRQKTWDFDFS